MKEIRWALPVDRLATCSTRFGRGGSTFWASEVVREGLRPSPDADRVTSESNIILNSGRSRVEAEHAIFDLNRRIYQLRKARATYYNDQG